VGIFLYGRKNKIKKILQLYCINENGNYSVKWYVDDIIVYLYGKNTLQISRQVYHIIKYVILTTGFIISAPKCFSTFDLSSLGINKIKSDTKYLGMFYTKNKYTYVNLVNREVGVCYGFDLYHFEDTINYIEMNDVRQKILGKLNYRLSGLYGCDDLNNLTDIKQFLTYIGWKNISDNLSLIDFA